MFYLYVILFLAAAAVGWALTLMGMPGNWLMVIVAGLYAWFGLLIGWPAVIGLVVLAILGELIELAAGVWGSHRAGGSRRAALFALLGSFGGALLGVLIGLPIPLAGPPIAALVGGAIGALGGAAIAELSLGVNPRKSWHVGRAAFWGRLWGTGIKTVVATVIAVTMIVAIVI